MLLKNVPVRVSALFRIIISCVPSKATPFIVLAVLNLVAVSALPDKAAPINLLASITSNLLVPVLAVTLPVTFPIRSDVILVAEKLP